MRAGAGFLAPEAAPRQAQQARRRTYLLFERLSTGHYRAKRGAQDPAEDGE
jgi:hypothetical protein